MVRSTTPCALKQAFPVVFMLAMGMQGHGFRGNLCHSGVVMRILVGNEGIQKFPGISKPKGRIQMFLFQLDRHSVTVLGYL